MIEELFPEGAVFETSISVRKLGRFRELPEEAQHVRCSLLP